MVLLHNFAQRLGGDTNRHGAPSLCARAQTESPPSFRAPAVGGVIGRNAASMQTPGADRGEGESAGNSDGHAAIIFASVSEFTVTVLAPTVGCPARRDATGTSQG